MKPDLIASILSLIMVSAFFQDTVHSQVYTTAKIYQTSKSGDRLSLKASEPLATVAGNAVSTITLHPDTAYQQITGFGGAFTQSSAYVLRQLSSDKRNEVLDAYFRPENAGYSLMRTHINSCDFSLANYAYDTTAGDKELKDFSIAEDLKYLVPLIHDAMQREGASFKILASPWTAPPWMKDNNAWNNGFLLPEYYPTWALYFSKYIREYRNQGIPIWGVTVENEPENNSGAWETMIFTPATMKEFVRSHLAPQFKKEGLDTKIIIFDHNRDRVKEWADGILSDPETARSVWGTAVHWYSSTTEWYPDALNEVHRKFPDKEIIQTEGCIDSEVPRWHNDTWYWEKKAQDWGYTYAAEADKPLHPRYVPVYRYACDIIGGLNSWLTGWIDWNIVLDTQGGPNHVKNWCCAPVIAKPETDEVYYTPLYYTMMHFSKFIRPGARRIGLASEMKNLMMTACKNPDGSIAIVILNRNEDAVKYKIVLGSKCISYRIEGNALQTIVIEG